MLATLLIDCLLYFINLSRIVDLRFHRGELDQNVRAVLAVLNHTAHLVQMTDRSLETVDDRARLLRVVRMTVIAGMAVVMCFVVVMAVPVCMAVPMCFVVVMAVPVFMAVPMCIAVIMRMVVRVPAVVHMDFRFMVF